MAAVISYLVFVILLLMQGGSSRASPIDIYREFEELMREYIPIPSDNENSNELLQKPDQQPENLCKMPMRKGVCRALIPRWSYDSKTKECREFKFGGCDGNENNFRTKKLCMKTCKGF